MPTSYGGLLAEGKTKAVYARPGHRDVCIIMSKDDITARDDPMYTKILPGKGVLNTRTASNVFRLLERHRIPTAYVARYDDRAFLAERCAMIPVEVVVRRYAYGSYLERNPHIGKGARLDGIKCEFFLKTNGRKWGALDLPVDDPLMMDDTTPENVRLYDPHKTFDWSDHFAIIGRREVVPKPDIGFDALWGQAIKTFWILEKEFGMYGARLADFKIEFGISACGALLLADVITCDEWRLLIGGDHYDKQAYREGLPLDEVKRRYEHVAAITDAF